MNFFKKLFRIYFLQNNYTEKLTVSSYKDDLNKQCLKFIPFINIIALLAWLPYISIDRELHPKFSLILFFRLGLSFFALISIIIFYFKLISKNMGIKLMVFLGFYLISATAIITGMSSGIPIYFSGFLFIIMCFILIPVRFYILWTAILTGLVIFIITSYFSDLSFQTPFIQYSISDIIAACMVSLLFSFIVDKTRYKSYLKTLEIEKERNQLKFQKDNLEKEIVLAKKIQESLIPAEAIKIPGVSIATFYKPMKSVGGDFYDFINLSDPNLFGIFISDVSGHGMPAALITSMVKTLVVTAGDNRLKPASLLKFINEKITDQTGGNFLTAFYGIYNTENNIFKYAKGAHNPPYLIRNNEITYLHSNGKMLGIFESVSFEEVSIKLNSGDKLIFYTDGLTEAINPNGIEFEELLPDIFLKMFIYLYQK